MKFTVYADLAPEVRKKLDRMAKKAVRYGVPFAYTVGEEHPQQIAVRKVDQMTQTIHTLNTYTVPAVDFEVECDGLICTNGWTVLAKVEHGDKGNIVTTFGGCKAKPEWYTAAPNCDHCRTNRYRAVTFFVEHEDGSIRQVGRTCLKDYTGINPITAAMWAEVQDLVNQDVSCTRSERVAGGSVQMYEVLGILAHACDVVKEFGYRKSSEPGSTRGKVEKLVAARAEPSEVGLAKAREIADWLTAMELSEASDLEHNCITLVLSGYAKLIHIGRLAYMPVAYDRYLERKAWETKREQERKAAAESSEYVGTIGQRITVKVNTSELVTSWYTNWGTTWLYKFTDENGNVFVWFSSRPCQASDGATIKGTVKAHNERDGIKQTVLTRCSVAGVNA